MIAQSQEDPPHFPRQKQKRKPFAERLVLATSLFSGGALALAIPNLVSGSPVLVAAKTALLTGAATVVSYGVNKLAVERGAPLTNNGYLTTALASPLSILAVGGALWSATYSGIVYPDVERLALERYSTQLSEYVGGIEAGSAVADNAASAITAISADLAAKAECERSASCLSGHSGGGYGPVSRSAEAVAGKAQALASSVDAGRVKRRSTIASLAGLQTKLGDILSLESIDRIERRRAVQDVARSVHTATADLNASIPLAELKGYAAELRGGAAIPGRPEAERRLSAILRGHGDTLAQSLSTPQGSVAKVPAFPEKTGVTDTFAYIGHFLPIAAITGVVELIAPICVWLYAYTSLHCVTTRGEQRPPTREHEADLRMRRLLPSAEDFAAAVEEPGIVSKKPVGEAAEPPRARRAAGRPRKRSPVLRSRNTAGD